MVGPSNSTNKFGSSSYVVGTPANGLGNGVNFTSIQAAYDQAVLDGYGVLNPTTVIIRPGVYTENLTVNDGGISFDCPSNAISGGAAIITGNLTLNVTGINAFAFSNLTFSSTLNPTVIATGAATPIRASFNNCTFTCTDPGTSCIDIGVPSGTFGFMNFRDCQISSDGAGIYNSSRTVVVFENSDSTSSSGAAIVLDSTGRLSAEFSSLTSISSYGVLFNSASNQCTIYNSNITSSLNAIETTVGGAANVYKSTINTSDASGYWIAGTATLGYCDVINLGTASALDPGLGVITIPDWKPYAEAGAAPGTGVVKGTCCFDSSQFNVVDGFVQYTGSSGFQWVEQNSSVTVNPNEGNFSVANITLTLPAQPQPMGTTVKFKVVTNDTLVIAGNVGDVLQLGNQSGTTITSTASGDAIELTHYDLGIWIANASIGNFIVA